MSEKLRAKINQENGGFIVKTRVKGKNYTEENSVFTDLDAALKFVKTYMEDKPKKTKKETVAAK